VLQVVAHGQEQVQWHAMSLEVVFVSFEMIEMPRRGWG